MAKKSSIERNNKRKRLSAQFADKRAALKAVFKDPASSAEDRFNATMKLAALPRNSSPVRVRARCELTGRPRGNYRKFKMCRISLRDLASRGEIPGMVKSSW